MLHAALNEVNIANHHPIDGLPAAGTTSDKVISSFSVTFGEQMALKRSIILLRLISARTVLIVFSVRLTTQ